ncbi:hypothetical protein [Cupriavidus basilensis]|uniref:Transposase n=1 Tax=Cupriavidus basilensis TaxID=68895 RepID=A0A0C4YD65_9BURK|nr:hypothetical protein [Cupriavidus basilensis]AJG20720.1 hypothetical protein RR42_m3352 [Cupriavidus basilensis]
MVLLHPPPCSPALNLIAIVWKQARRHWGNSVTRAKETIGSEITELLGGYGEKRQINFS